MKKFGAFLLAGVLAIGTLTGCGSTDKKAEGSTGSTDSKVIKVAASATPHAEILEEAKPLLEKEGYDLEVTVFDDYVQPNEVVDLSLIHISSVIPGYHQNKKHCNTIILD